MILHVAAQDTALDKNFMLAWITFIVDRETAAFAHDIAVVIDRDEFACYAFADAPAVERRSLAIEIALEPVTDRLV